MKSAAVVCLGLFAACGEVTNKLADAPGGTDGSIDAPPDAIPPRCDPSKPFGAPVAVTELNSTANDYTATLTADELQIMFSSTRPGGLGGSDVYLATRTSTTAPFGAPTLLAGINTAGMDSRPTLTSDGLTLYLEYLPPVGGAGGDWNIVRATRATTATSFGAPQPVVALNSANNDTAPFVLPDHSAIYLVSNRAGSNVYRSATTGGTFAAPAIVGGLLTGPNDNEDYPALTPDELTMYFASTRPGGQGRTDIWVATRTSAVTAFSAPVNATRLNSTTSEAPSWISADTCVIYLHREVGSVAANYDLYVATRPL